RAGPKRASPMLREEPSASAPRDSDGPELAGDDGQPDDAGAPARRISKRMPLQLAALIDACAPITLDAPVAGDAVLAQLPSKRHVRSKLVIGAGLHSETRRA